MGVGGWVMQRYEKKVKITNFSDYICNKQDTICVYKKYMACTTDFIDFVCSQIEGVGVIRAKKMFGDWMIYIDEKPIILACDNTCYVKMLPVIADMMTDAGTGFPYDGAKEHYILDIEHRDEAIKVIKALLPVIPYPKKRKK